MSDYFKIHLHENKHRAVVWEVIGSYLERHILKHGTILELGPGYCDYINSSPFEKKIAIDSSKTTREFADPSVQLLVEDLNAISSFPSEIDLILCSNIFEHLPLDSFRSILAKIHESLSEHGRLIVIQPNFKYSYRSYFDDFTHQTIFTDTSMVSHLKASGFRIVAIEKKFLPFSMKELSSQIPLSILRFLIRLYLISPFKPKAGQMLLVAERETPNCI